MEELGQSTTTLRDRRYDAVLHMTTAADGAARRYTSQHGESAEARGDGLEGRPRAWGRSPRGFPDPRKTQGERVGRKIHSTIALRFEDRRSRN